jgi:hypothetical protein
MDILPPQVIQADFNDYTYNSLLISKSRFIFLFKTLLCVQTVNERIVTCFLNSDVPIVLLPQILQMIYSLRCTWQIIFSKRGSFKRAFTVAE